MHQKYIKKSNGSGRCPSKIEIHINYLGFTIRVFGWLLPETHQMYKDNYRSLKHITILQLANTTIHYSFVKG